MPLNYPYNNPYLSPTYMSGYGISPNNMQAQNPSPITQLKPMEWVDGEVGARAFQMPAGWPANTLIPMWDSTDTVIYLKSVNQVGMPNPMQKLKYTMEEVTPTPALVSGQTAPSQPGQYITKDDFDEFKKEIKGMLTKNQNGSNQGRNENSGPRNRGDER